MLNYAKIIAIFVIAKILFIKIKIIYLYNNKRRATDIDH